MGISEDDYQTVPEYDFERPEGEMQSDTETMAEDDDKWYGVPPKGEQILP